jgi:hypothetical protein
VRFGNEPLPRTASPVRITPLRIAIRQGTPDRVAPVRIAPIRVAKLDTRKDPIGSIIANAR